MRAGQVQHSRPYLGSREARAASRVVSSRLLAHGTAATRLEIAWARLTERKYAACVGSGLGAIRLGLLALGVGEDDEVMLPAYACVAVTNAVLAIGARPAYVDVIQDDWTISPEDALRRSTRRTKALIAVHTFGMPAKVHDLNDLNVPIVEDCAHGVGSLGSGRPFGSVGKVNMSSFYATKFVAGGGGGIVGSDSKEIIQKVVRSRDYQDQLPNRHHLNDNITDLEAVIALEQVRRLRTISVLRERRAIAYESKLKELEKAGLIHLPMPRLGRVWYRYAVRLERHRAKDVCNWMSMHGVRAEQPVWDFRRSKFWVSDLKRTNEAFERIVSLPLYPDLTADEQRRVVRTFYRCLRSVRTR